MSKFSKLKPTKSNAPEKIPMISEITTSWKISANKIANKGGIILHQGEIIRIDKSCEIAEDRIWIFYSVGINSKVPCPSIKLIFVGAPLINNEIVSLFLFSDSTFKVAFWSLKSNFSVSSKL